MLVVGTAALVAEISAVGLTPTDTAAGATAVVQGLDPQLRYATLAEACIALRAGAVWVACNLDPTLPSERGPLPGNGSLVAVLRTATRREPQVAGKPAPALMRTAARRVGASAPLVVGDRLDTDIQGGRAAGMPTLLVLTGVSDAAELLAAPPEARPDYVGTDLAALDLDPDDLALGPRPGWTVDGGPDGLVLSGTGAPLDALRALCVRHWDTGGGPPRSGRTAPTRPPHWRAGSGTPPVDTALLAALDLQERWSPLQVAPAIRWPEPTPFRAPRDADPARGPVTMSSATSSAASCRTWPAAAGGPADPAGPGTGGGGRRRGGRAGGLADRPLAEHVAVFEQVHVALGHALADGAVADGAAGTPGRV